MIRRFLCLALTAACFIPSAAAAAPAAPATGAKAFVLMDSATGRVLSGRNADSPMLIASTTKIMTALVVLECAGAGGVMTIPAEAQGVEGSSMYVRAGESYPVSEVLSGLMLLSGNDAAVALAIHCAGSVGAFAERMNAKAAELGMANTVFHNPHGLWDENISTARDMAVLACAAMRSEAFASIAAQKYARVGSMTARNHNRLLWALPGCEGLKTGFTRKAGRCLVTSTKRGLSRFIVVTLNDGSDWRDHKALTEFAFAEYPCRALAQAGEAYTVPVAGGTLGEAILEAADGIALPLSAAELERVKTEVRFARFFWAPLRKGQVCGSIRVSLDGETLSETPLTARDDIPARTGRRKRT
ncbi:MAG: D-alanyl-D-alanine carboxypeptidase [Oscillospiraceae bacterium]|nr:D-alanyl-D-alanine carboxypeptidase [Oscillospiraceae bacterium]